MIKKIFLGLVLLAAISSCSNESKKEPVTNVEVATAFVRDILDNKLNDAEKYLLKDETNQQIYERFKQKYDALDKNVLQKYKEADIITNNINTSVDSICIFNYSTSYKRNDTTILKLVRVDNKWLVDMKYTSRIIR